MPTVRNFGTMATHTLTGGQVGLTYQGPIHFGMSTSSHPFRTDRRWKQVHAGLGYDIPLHELAPGNVNVRARPGPRDGLDLEIETPFHTTDRSHLRGVQWLLENRGVGFEQTGAEVPDAATGAGDILGQWYLRTNLWSQDSTQRTTSETNNLFAASGELHGPAPADMMVNSDAWDPFWFWSDHPTDHFHAGAVPIGFGRNFGGTYGDVYLGRADLTHPLDWIANSEQLLSSVDVHLNKGVKPMWDSGSIVSAQGIGYKDPTQGSRVEGTNQAFSGAQVPESNTWGNYGGVNQGHGLGLGQRVIRTNDGTLHTFVLGRTAQKQTDDNSTPTWIHHKKPQFGDLFWSSREQKVNTNTGNPPVWTGKDEVGPTMWGYIGTVSDLRVHGASFASDSEGTIHAVIEVCDSTSGSHSLWYHKAPRKLISYNPDPVYDWRWDETTAVRILGSAAGTLGTFGEDFREPSLVIDRNDTLHLAFTAVADGSPLHAKIYYTQKRPSESWATWDPDFRYGMVSHSFDETNDTTAPFPVTGVDKPKIMLRGDNVPVVFYRGSNVGNPTATRRHSAVYANIASATTEGGSSLHNFDTTQSYPVGGYTNSGNDVSGLITTHSNDGVTYYDAIIDEQDIAWVVYVMTQDTMSNEPDPHLTRITTFNSMISLASQYDTTTNNGLGLSTTLYHNGSTSTPDMGLNSKYASPTITTDGKGNIHVVGTVTYQGVMSTTKGASGSDKMVKSPLLRDAGTTPPEHAPYPLAMPGVKAGDEATNPSAPNQDDKGGYGPDTATLESEITGWPGASTSLYNPRGITHLLEMWWPAHEYSTPASGEWVIRSMNYRWLSVPSMKFNATTGYYVPLGQADTISGNEPFTHLAPQLRYQRFHGFDASYLDLIWNTNEKSWISTPHSQSRYYWPFGHAPGTIAEPGTDGWDSGTHRLGIPGHGVVDP